MLGDSYVSPLFHHRQIVAQSLPNFYGQSRHYPKLCPISHAPLQVLS